MGIIIWLIISIVIATPYVVFHFRRNSGDTGLIGWGLDWVSLLATVFGGVALGQLMSQTMTTTLTTPWMLLIVAPFLILLVLMLTLPRKALAEIVRPTIDERVAAISSKSARNALLVNYLVLLVLIIIDQDPIDKSLLVILPGSGLLVFYSSYLFYFYTRS